MKNSDFILLVGTNPRLEATILNTRIRKAYLKNKLKIYSIGDPGDLTYPYQNIGSSTSIIRDIASGSHEISDKIKKIKKTINYYRRVSSLWKIGEYIFETLKNFLLIIILLKKIGML